MTRAAILLGAERRRRWSAAEKLRIVGESMAPEARVTDVAHRHDVHPNLLHLWRRQARSGVLSVTTDRGPCFLPVAIAAGNGAAAGRSAAAAGGLEPAIEVVLRNGRVLRLSAGVAPARAVALADALEGLAR
jgi:transposase